jgi:hypothetical protein
VRDRKCSQSQRLRCSRPQSTGLSSPGVAPQSRPSTHGPRDTLVHEFIPSDKPWIARPGTLSSHGDACLVPGATCLP